MADVEEEDRELPPSIEETLRKLEEGLKDVRKEVEALRRIVARMEQTHKPLCN